MFDQNQPQMVNGFMGNPYGAMPNQYYNPNPLNSQPTKISNLLTEEEIRELQKNNENFSLGLTTMDTYRAACTHRQPDGLHDSLTYDRTTGIARCTICGYEFEPLDANTTYEEIVDYCHKLQNVLQTIKLMWPDIPASAREFFYSIGLIDKIPKLFEFAAKNFNKNELDLWNANYSSMAGMNLLNNLGNILGATQQQFSYGYGQQPMMNPGMGAMGMPQQPMMNPGMGMPQAAPQVNPFGYDGASQVQQPMMNPGMAMPNGPVAQPVNPQTGFSYVPQPNTVPVQPSATPSAPVQVTAPAPEAPKEETTVSQQLTV